MTSLFLWSAFWHRFIVPWGKSSTCSLFQFTYLDSRNKLALRNEDYLAGLLKWWTVTDVGINMCCRDASKLCCGEVFWNSCHTMSSRNFRFYTAVHLQQKGSGIGANGLFLVLFHWSAATSMFFKHSVHNNKKKKVTFIKLHNSD